MYISYIIQSSIYIYIYTKLYIYIAINYDFSHGMVIVFKGSILFDRTWQMHRHRPIWIVC